MEPPKIVLKLIIKYVNKSYLFLPCVIKPKDKDKNQKCHKSPNYQRFFRQENLPDVVNIPLTFILIVGGIFTTSGVRIPR